jgi:DNA gyrase/topoisomerase IV subunit A
MAAKKDVVKTSRTRPLRASEREDIHAVSLLKDHKITQLNGEIARLQSENAALQEEVTRLHEILDTNMTEGRIAKDALLDAIQALGRGISSGSR